MTTLGQAFRSFGAAVRKRLFGNPFTEKVWRIFLSSTNVDLREYRAEVRAALDRMGYKSQVQEDMVPQDGDAVEVSLDWVRHSDIFVGILAFRYGYVPDHPDGQKKSVTEREYDEATRLDIPRLMFLVDPQVKDQWIQDADHLDSDPAAIQALQTFKARVERERVRGLFSSKERLATDVVIAVQKTIERRIRRRRWLEVLTLIAGTALIGGLLLLLMYFLAPQQFYAFGVRTHLIAATKLPAGGGLNVVVAGFGYADRGSITQNELAKDVSIRIKAEVQQVAGTGGTIVGIDDPGVEWILSDDPRSAQQQALEIAQTLDAHLVIYGLVTNFDGQGYDIAPQFVINPDLSLAGNQPELAESGAFGAPFRTFRGELDNAELTRRVQTIRLFLQGLTNFYNGKYPEALTRYQDAIDLNAADMRDLEVLYIFAGNAAIRLNQSQPALELYTASLLNRPTYARGLLGRGSALFRLGAEIWRNTGGTLRYDPTLTLPVGSRCYTPTAVQPDRIELLLELAELCYVEAENSTDFSEVADLDIKIANERALLSTWRSKFGYGDQSDIEAAVAQFQRVFTLYAEADAAKRSRIRHLVARAYGAYADLLEFLYPGDAQKLLEAHAQYCEAMSVFAADVDRKYASTFVPGYQTRAAAVRTQIATLQPASELSAQSLACD